MMRKIISKSRKNSNKKISFLEGLEIVKLIQKKIEIINRSKPTSPSCNEYSF